MFANTLSLEKLIYITEPEGVFPVWSIHRGPLSISINNWWPDEYLFCTELNYYITSSTIFSIYFEYWTIWIFWALFTVSSCQAWEPSKRQKFINIKAFWPKPNYSVLILMYCSFPVVMYKEFNEECWRGIEANLQ